MTNEEELNRIIVSLTNLEKSPINKTEDQGVQYRNQSMCPVPLLIKLSLKDGIL